MATQVATQILAKGPLSSALGQWMFLGFGTFVIFTGDNGVGQAAKDIAAVAFRMVTGTNFSSSAALLREAALNNSAGGQQYQPQQPIVIHSVSNGGSSSKGWTATVVQLTVGAGACWGAYILFSNFLPEQIKEMLPVTRKYFETAVTSLGQGIIRVREALSEQIAGLSSKQDELSDKQDITHGEVLGIKGDIGDVRLNIDDIAIAISRCENSLGDAEGRQTYMSRGVRLLVHCVGDMMRHNNPSVAEELDQFNRMSAELMDDEDFYYKENNNSGGTPNNRHVQHLEDPSSPNLSEIGSTTSTMVNDHSYHHISNMCPLSLPRPCQSESVVTPTSSSSNHPISTSKIMRNSNSISIIMNPSPSMLRNISSPPGLKMLQSFNSRISEHNSGTATTLSSSSSSSSSSKEKEVRRWNASNVN